MSSICESVSLLVISDHFIWFNKRLLISLINNDNYLRIAKEISLRILSKKSLAMKMTLNLIDRRLRAA